MNNRSNRYSWRAALAVAVATSGLAACGGVDDLAPGPADKYAGTWVSACESADDLNTVDQPDRPLKATYQLTLARVDSHKLRFAVDYQVYPSSGCSGHPLAVHTNRSDDNTYVIDGDQAIAGSDADKITVNMAALGGPTNGGAPVVVNGIRYPADFFISSVHDNKDLIARSGSGLRFGSGEAVDAGDYPVALDAVARLSRR